MQPSCGKWQFTRKQIETESPSSKDGISLKLENSTRRLALAFCHDVGFMLKMNQYTIATAMTYWQRFFMFQSHAKNDAYLIAAAALLLAGKVEENFKSLQKITETAYYVRSRKEPAAAERIKKDLKLLLAEMERITKAEEVLLVTLDFDFSTSHPHSPLCKVIKELGLHTKGDRTKEQFCQIAWNFSNDSLKTTLCLQPHSSTDIAVACVNLAATTVHYELPTSPGGKPWWARFGATKEVLKDVERQIMSMYKRKDGDSSRTSAASGLSFPPTPSLAAAGAPLLRCTPSPGTAAKVGTPTTSGQGPVNHERRERKANGTLEDGRLSEVNGVMGHGGASGDLIENSRVWIEAAEGDEQVKAASTQNDSALESQYTNGIQEHGSETQPEEGGIIEGPSRETASTKIVSTVEVAQEQEEVEMEVDEPEPAVSKQAPDASVSELLTTAYEVPSGVKEVEETVVLSSRPSGEQNGEVLSGQSQEESQVIDNVIEQVPSAGETATGQGELATSVKTAVCAKDGGTGQASVLNGSLDLDEELLTELEDVVATTGAPQTEKQELVNGSTCPPHKQNGDTIEAAKAPSKAVKDSAANSELPVSIAPVIEMLEPSSHGPSMAAEASGTDDHLTAQAEPTNATEIPQVGSRADRKRSRWEPEEEGTATEVAASKVQKLENGKNAHLQTSGEHEVANKSGEVEEGPESLREGNSPSRGQGSLRRASGSPSPRRHLSPSKSGSTAPVGMAHERSPVSDRDRPWGPSPEEGAARRRSPGADWDRSRRLSPDGWRHHDRKRDWDRDERGRGWDGHGRDSRHRAHGHEQREKERDRERESERSDGDRGRDYKEKHREGDREKERGRYPRSHGHH